MKRVLAIPFGVLAMVWIAVPAAAGPLEGLWELTEQHYEAGRSNLLDADSPVFLEFRRVGTSLAVTMRGGPGSDVVHPWPAMVADDGPLPVTVLERELDERSGSARVRYHVVPSPRDALVLDVVESYTSSEDGDVLTGTMVVTFLSGDDERGGFTLHRRFERRR